MKIDLIELEEMYGADLAQCIDDEIRHCEEEHLTWKFEVIEETNRFTTFAFATKSYTGVYEVSKNYKRVSEKYHIGRQDCIAVLNLMNSIKA